MQTLRAVAAVADMPETDRLVATLEAWWPAIEVLIITGVTNARTEAANTTIKNIKRTGPRIPQREQLHRPYPADQRREDRRVNTPQQAVFTTNREEPHNARAPCILIHASRNDTQMTAQNAD